MLKFSQAPFLHCNKNIKKRFSVIFFFLVTLVHIKFSLVLYLNIVCTVLEN